jgi:hypothetical protein
MTNKKWIGCNRDSSNITTHKRKNALLKDTYETFKITGNINPNNITNGSFNPFLKSTTLINNEPNTALRSVRSGGYTVPPKVSQKNVN